jgi:TonB family protein
VQRTQYISVVAQTFRPPKMLEPKPRSTIGTSQDQLAAETRHQSRKLLLALVILLVAITTLLVTDRQFWFGSDQLILDSDGTEPTAAPNTGAASKAAKHSESVPAPTAKKNVPSATSTQPKGAQTKIAGSHAVTATRTVLPPLNVEVVAGDAHRTIHPNTPKIEIEDAAPNATAMTNAAGREHIPGEAAPQASYPLLAQHMNVQGSVVLKALIGADGTIEEMHVLSGPAILAAAAQQAVREWHFKPVVQNGQRVETMAKIVVNFSIKVADNSEKTTLAESRADGLLIFTR